MRKAFKVATAFTGAAACAAVFTPGAMGATATTAKTLQVNPDIAPKNCTATSTTSMVFWWVSGAHGPNCVGGSPGGPGTTTALNNGKYVSRICTGNNWGWIVHSDIKQHFGQDYSLDRSVWKVSQVHISGWSGGWKCYPGAGPQ